MAILPLGRRQTLRSVWLTLQPLASLLRFVLWLKRMLLLLLTLQLRLVSLLPLLRHQRRLIALTHLALIVLGNQKAILLLRGRLLRVSKPLRLLVLAPVALLLQFPAPSILQLQILVLAPVPLNTLPLVLLQLWIPMMILRLPVVGPQRAIKVMLSVQSALRNAHRVPFSTSSGARKRLNVGIFRRQSLSINSAVVTASVANALPAEMILRLRPPLLPTFSKLLPACLG